MIVASRALASCTSRQTTAVPVTAVPLPQRGSLLTYLSAVAVLSVNAHAEVPQQSTAQALFHSRLSPVDGPPRSHAVAAEQAASSRNPFRVGFG